MTQPPNPPYGSPYPPQYPPQPVQYDSSLQYGQEPRQPPVLPWFVAYCVLMALMYLVVAAAGIFFLVAAPAAPNRDAIELQIQGGIFTVMGLPLLAAFGAAPFLPRRPWVWIYDMVLICLGRTSVCCLPATIPLLIYWLKPETKMWFGRGMT